MLGFVSFKRYNVNVANAIERKIEMQVKRYEVQYAERVKIIKTTFTI